MYLYNYCSIRGAFYAEKTENQYLHEELFDPQYAYFYKRLLTHWTFVSQGHNVYALNKERIWRKENTNKIAELSINICETFTKIRKAEVSMLGIIKKMYAFSEMNEEEQQAFLLEVEARKRPKK